MPRFFHTALLAAAMASSATVALAQYGPQNRYEPRSVEGAINRVHADLNRAYEGGWRINGGDRKRLDHAEHELREFANKWNRGRFDKGELDDAISAIHHVADHNRMGEGRRDELFRDLDMLRDMREAYNRHELGPR